MVVQPGDFHDRYPHCPLCRLILRVTLGILFLAHAGLKIFVFTPAGAAQFFGSLGLPPFLAYMTILIETIGGLALIAGFIPAGPRWHLCPSFSAPSSRCTARPASSSTIPTAAGNIWRSGSWRSWRRHCWAMEPMRSAPDRTNCPGQFSTRSA